MFKKISILFTMFFTCFIFLFSFSSCSKTNKQTEVNCIEDIYKLDKNKANFNTIYVIINDENIEFYENIYENTDEIDEAKYLKCEIKNLKYIETFENEQIQISTLKTNDKFILYHNRSKELYTNPPVKYAIRAFYIGTEEINI